MGVADRPRFRSDDRQKIAPKLAAFIAELQSEMDQAGLMTYLAAADAHVAGIVNLTVSKMPPDERAQVVASICAEAQTLADNLSPIIASGNLMPTAAVIALLYLLDEQIRLIDEDPWSHPWLKKAMEAGTFGVSN